MSFPDSRCTMTGRSRAAAARPARVPDTRIRLLLALLLTGSALVLSGRSAQAEIYKLVDQYGRITYSSVPMQGAKKLTFDSPPVSSLSSGPSLTHRSARSMATPVNYPRVDSRVQKSRDVRRREILQHELLAEERLLADARQALQQNIPARVVTQQVAVMTPGQTGPVYDEKTRKLQDQVLQHERNVSALKKELVSL